MHINYSSIPYDSKKNLNESQNSFQCCAARIVIRSRHQENAPVKLTRFNNVRLVLNVLAQAWITPPQFESPAVLKPKAHIERYLKSFPTIRIIRSIFPPIYRFWMNIAIKRGKELERRRSREKEENESKRERVRARK